jgi:hypothetical protein
MRVPAALCVCLVSAWAQSAIDVGKPYKGNFDGLKPGDLIFKVPHIHTMPRDCAGQPDAVYGRQDGVYYACKNNKVVCSKEEGAIPRDWVAAYDALRREHDERMKEFRAANVREGRAISEDPWVNHRAAIAEHQARVAEAREGHAAGRRPNFGGAGANASGAAARPAMIGALEAVAPPSRLEPSTVSEEQLKEIATGMARTEVLRRLGEPYMKITGDVVYYTYQMTSGSVAKLEFENEKLTRLRTVASR